MKRRGKEKEHQAYQRKQEINKARKQSQTSTPTKRRATTTRKESLDSRNGRKDRCVNK
jgi:hypothetical protein